MSFTRVGGPTRAGSIPAVGFGASAPTCMTSSGNRRLQSCPVNVPQKVPFRGRQDAPLSHGARPPAVRASKHGKDDRPGQGTCRRLQDVGTLIAVIVGRKTGGSEQAAEHPTDGHAVHGEVANPCCNTHRASKGAVSHTEYEWEITASEIRIWYRDRLLKA